MLSEPLVDRVPPIPQRLPMPCPVVIFMVKSQEKRLNLPAAFTRFAVVFKRFFFKSNEVSTLFFKSCFSKFTRSFFLSVVGSLCSSVDLGCSRCHFSL